MPGIARGRCALVLTAPNATGTTGATSGRTRVANLGLVDASTADPYGWVAQPFTFLVLLAAAGFARRSACS